MIEFIKARLKALFLEQGYAATEIAAVLSVGDLNPYDIALRLKAIKHFNAKPVSQNLAAANKRVANILAKLDEPVVDPAVNPSLLDEPAEIQLHEQLTSMKAKVDELISAQDYQSALDLMAELQATVDQFFDDVMVMAEDPLIKENRINLLASLRALFMNIADISSLQK